MTAKTTKAAITENPGTLRNGVTFKGLNENGVPIWYLRLRFVLPSGQKVNRSFPPVRGGTRLAAERSLLKEQHKIMEEGVAGLHTLNVRRLMNGWLNMRRSQERPHGLARSGRKDRSLSPKTILINVDVVEMHILPDLGDHRVAALTAEVLEAFYQRLSKKSPKNRPDKVGLNTTVERAHSIFRQALDWAIGKKWVTHNAAVQAYPPRVVAIRRQERQAAGIGDYWTTEEVVRLTDACLTDGSSHALAVAFAVHTGLRIGETYGLQWGDITQPDAEGQVFMSVQRGADAYGRLSTLKTSRSRRRIKLYPEAVRVLEAARAWQTRKAQRAPWTPPQNPDNLAVFSTIDGKINYSTNGRDVRLRVCAAAGVPVLPFHSARHTFIHEQAFVAGQPLQKVSRYVGHASQDVTDRHYGFWTDTNDLD